MKVLVLIFIGLLVVGCGKKKLTLEDKVVGTYESKIFLGDIRQVFLETGIVEEYLDGEKMSEDKWEIIDGEIQIEKVQGSLYYIFSINSDSSLTYYELHGGDGERQGVPPDYQYTAKKVK